MPLVAPDIYERLAGQPAPSSRWRRYLVGNGALEATGSALRLLMADASSRRYSDAQIDDYRVVPGHAFPWYPPLRLVLRARFSHPVGVFRGTAGFGFWNYPFLMPEGRLPTLPRVLWFFFASPPSDMPLDQHTPGHGWKVAAIDALSPRALWLAPLAPLAVLLMNHRSLYQALWPHIQRRLSISEAVVPPELEMTDWHIYTIEWGTETARFSVDGQVVLEPASSPCGPLCCVVWVDNQYLVVKPWGRVGWGLLDVPGRQWVEVEWLAIEHEDGMHHDWHD
ncbi:MAG: hypothetical protein HC884_03215 [Chloroflexaceae bacterium]|nr:hypothetical protein [Chloroflexaceae bacterium]